MRTITRGTARALSGGGGVFFVAAAQAAAQTSGEPGGGAESFALAEAFLALPVTERIVLLFGALIACVLVFGAAVRPKESGASAAERTDPPPTGRRYAPADGAAARRRLQARRDGVLPPRALGWTSRAELDAIEARLSRLRGAKRPPSAAASSVTLTAALYPSNSGATTSARDARGATPLSAYLNEFQGPAAMEHRVRSDASAQESFDAMLARLQAISQFHRERQIGGTKPVAGVTPTSGGETVSG